MGAEEHEMVRLKSERKKNNKFQRSLRRKSLREMGGAHPGEVEPVWGREAGWGGRTAKTG